MNKKTQEQDQQAGCGQDQACSPTLGKGASEKAGHLQPGGVQRDHPQEQAAQQEGGGGAPGTGDQQKTPAAETVVPDQETG